MVESNLLLTMSCVIIASYIFLLKCIFNFNFCISFSKILVTFYVLELLHSIHSFFIYSHFNSNGYVAFEIWFYLAIINNIATFSFGMGVEKC